MNYQSDHWQGTAFASVSPIANAVRLVTDCLGTGITSVPIVITLQTRTSG